MDDTRLHLVEPNNTNIDEVVRELCKNVQEYIVLKTGQCAHMCDDSMQYLRSRVAEVSAMEGGNPGTLIMTEGIDEKGAMHVLRNVLVLNFENTRHLDKFTDVIINHELLHAVETFIKDGKVVIGMHKENKDLDEWLTDRISVKITQMMHADGVVYNERVKPEDAIYDLCTISRKNVVKQPKMFERNEELLKDAVLVGDTRLAEKTLNEAELDRFTDKIKGYYDYMRDSVKKYIQSLQKKTKSIKQKGLVNKKENDIM